MTNYKENKKKFFKNNIFLLQVRELCERFGNKNFVFVSCPEVLLGGMAQATIREISIGRPGPRASHDSE